MRTVRGHWFAAILLAFGIGGCRAPAPTASSPSFQPGTAPRAGNADSPLQAQMLLGNPDDATNSPGNRQRYLMTRGQYALSYNDGLRFPNWVSWISPREILGTPAAGSFTRMRTCRRPSTT